MENTYTMFSKLLDPQYPFKSANDYEKCMFVLTKTFYLYADIAQRYSAFVDDRSGELPVPPDAGGVGLRATLM